jgi:hypothetical protein
MATENGNGEVATENGRAPVAEIEKAISQVAGIQAARVVTGNGGRIAEVHVLAAEGRAPKQLVRDVQSVVLTSFGITIDYRTVSVVQLDHPEPEVPARTPSTGAARPAITRLAAETSSFSTEVNIRLASDGDELTGTARGPASAGPRLVAEAVLDAVGRFMEAEGVEVESAGITSAGNRNVAMVVLRVMTSRGDHVVSGSAVVRKDANDAIARAVLAGLNRFLRAN